MRTTLTIKCDMRDAQAILYEASKIIRGAEALRGQDRLDRTAKVRLGFKQQVEGYTNPTNKHDDRKEWEVACPHCDWTGYLIELKIDGNKYMRCPKCHGHIIMKEGAK